MGPGNSSSGQGREQLGRGFLPRHLKLHPRLWRGHLKLRRQLPPLPTLWALRKVGACQLFRIAASRLRLHTAPRTHRMTTELVEEAPRPSTFAGKLKLEDFGFKDERPQPVPPEPAAVDNRCRRRCRRLAPRHGGPPSASLRRHLPRAHRRNSRTRCCGGSGRGKRQKSGYAPPSKYAHLPSLPDAIAPNLICSSSG